MSAVVNFKLHLTCPCCFFLPVCCRRHSCLLLHSYHHSPPPQVSNRYEPHYPSHLRSVWVSASLLVCLVCIGAIAAEVEALMYLTSVLETSMGTLGLVLGSGIVAFLVPILGGVLNKIAELLTANENHETDHAYDASLVVKVFALNLCNYFGALLYICFVKAHTYGCPNGCCMYAASVQFIAILAMITLVKIMNPIIVICKLEQRATSVVNWASKLFFKCVICVVNVLAWCARGYFGYLPRDYFTSASSQAAAAAGQNSDDAAQPWEQEFTREEYEGVFSDMAEVILLLMLVTCFFVVFPAAPLVLVFTNLLEIRMDAHKMMSKVRRPVPEASSGVGMWVHVVDLLAVLAAFINSAIVVFTTQSFSEYSTVFKALLWLGAASVFLAVRAFLIVLIPGVPPHLATVRKRHKFLTLKHVYGFMEDDDDDDDSDALRVRVFVGRSALLFFWPSRALLYFLFFIHDFFPGCIST